ncbi:MAG: hypothetical protein AAGD43_00240 [Pseudomonadota bacterium]
MNRMQSWAAAIAVVLGLPSTAAIALDGAVVYQDVCGRCHGLLEEQSWKRFLPKDGTPAELAVVLPQGPTLNGIIGRPVGIIEGYSYSNAMRAFAETGAVWDRETLDKFLTNSRRFVKGTVMIVKLDEVERASVLDYLEKVARYKN